MTETFRPQARPARGFLDKRAGDLRAERRIIDAVSAVYERYGFERLETGAFEYADALGKFLPDADRPNEGVFALQDDDEQWMALRYDLTAPLARFAAQNWDNLPKPFRRYAAGTVWRNEKPGPGRYREFIQCDADTVGSARPEADAEIIAMAVEGFVAAGLPASDFVLKINNRKLLNGLMASAGVADAGQKLGVLRAVDKLDRLGVQGVKLLLGAGRKDESGAFTKGAQLGPAAIDAVLAFVEAGGGTRSATLDRLSNVIGGSAEGDEGVEELSRIGAALAGLGVSEAHFTGQPVPATGFSFGVSRLAAALRASSRDAANEARGPVVVLALDQAAMGEYFAAAAELRASGVAAEVYLGSSGMRAQMKYADRRLSPAAVILGGDELAAGQVTIKDLDLGRALASGVSDNQQWRADRPGQVTIARGDMAATVRAILDAGA